MAAGQVVDLRVTVAGSGRFIHGYADLGDHAAAMVVLNNRFHLSPTADLKVARRRHLNHVKSDLELKYGDGVGPGKQAPSIQDVNERLIQHVIDIGTEWVKFLDVNPDLKPYYDREQIRYRWRTLRKDPDVKDRVAKGLALKKKLSEELIHRPPLKLRLKLPPRLRKSPLHYTSSMKVSDVVIQDPSLAEEGAPKVTPQEKGKGPTSDLDLTGNEAEDFRRTLKDLTRQEARDRVERERVEREREEVARKTGDCSKP